MKTIIEDDRDVESLSFDKRTVSLGWSTGSTIATVGHDGDADNDDKQECVMGSVEVALQATPKHEVGNPGRPRNNHTRVCPTKVISMSICFLVVFTLIASAILLTSSGKATPSKQTGHPLPMMSSSMMDPNPAAEYSDDVFYNEAFWNPVLDLRVVSDPTDPSRWILHDDMDVCPLSVVKAPYDSEKDALLGWGGVQPTAKSIAVLGILPHIQTSDDYFVELDNKSPIELGPDHDWTLSFAGARLANSDDEKVDIIFLGEKADGSPSSFAVCYEPDNSIGLGSCGRGKDSTTVVQLPFQVMEYHVVTLSYSEQAGKLQLFQNTQLVADLDYRSDLETTFLSMIGPPCFNDEPEEGDSSLNSTSNIAIRHVAYLEKHITDGSLEEITDVTLNMGT